MTAAGQVRVFLTYTHDCSYLPREARTMFVDPDVNVDMGLYSDLSRQGFRRSGNHYYRPHCDGCCACISCRIVAAMFTPSRRHRRIIRRNADVQIHLLDDIDNDECYGLYARYIEQRHADGDMFPPSRSQYDGFFG